jgi:glycosyltransferase involved in cell wall biosynthesis
MRILIVHNQLWAHYKALAFSHLQRLVDERPDVTMHVLQIALVEGDRQTLGTPDPAEHAYSHEVLFPTRLDQVKLADRTRALLRRTAAFRPDVVNLTGYYDPATWVLMAYCRLRGIRLILSNESTEADGPRSRLKETFKRVLIRQFQGFFTFGTRSAEYLIRLGATPSLIFSRRNAVDNARLLQVYETALPQRVAELHRLGLKSCNFIFVGRLIPVKNLSRLLKAFAQARQSALRGRDWGLILLGDGVQKAELQAQAGEGVAFLPGVPWHEVPTRLALADVFVLPSTLEPWGLVVNEAMACGLPVLVSERCGCAVDLVRDGENGFIIDPYDDDQLCSRLRQFMDFLPTDRQRFGERSRELIRTYTPERVALDMLDGFERVLAEK